MEEELKNRRDVFVGLLESTEREGVKDLIKWLDSSDFFSAPASHMFHGSYPGGLCEHSLNVFDEAKRLISIYPEIEISEDSLIISTLLHDLCKVNFYVKEIRNRKDKETGRWEQYDSYTIDEKFRFGGHGSKSVFLAQNFIKLTVEEAVAINCHMSSWDGNKDVGRAFEQHPFAWLVHVADESATFVKEAHK